MRKSGCSCVPREKIKFPKEKTSQNWKTETLASLVPATTCPPWPLLRSRVVDPPAPAARRYRHRSFGQRAWICSPPLLPLSGEGVRWICPLPLSWGYPSPSTRDSRRCRCLPPRPSRGWAQGSRSRPLPATGHTHCPPAASHREREGEEVRQRGEEDWEDKVGLRRKCNVLRRKVEAS